MEVQTYKNKPLEREAIELKMGEPINDYIQFVGKDRINFYNKKPKKDEILKVSGPCVLSNPSGMIRVMPGDYIVKGPEGDFYGVSKKTFEQAYDLVEDSKAGE